MTATVSDRLDLARPGEGARVRASGWGFRHPGRSTWAVRGVDLAIEPGERVLLLGPSGAGKTTLLHGLAGLLDDPATVGGDPNGAGSAGAGGVEGKLLVDGLPARTVRDRVGLVFQDPQTQLVMARAGDDVAFGLENHAVPTDRIWPQVDAALELVGFGYDRERATSALSGGEMQRLVLAGTLALRPSLLLLDEPTANLDPEGAATLRDALGHVLEETTATMILVEHRVGDWLPLVDRVIALDPDGGLLADSDPETAFAGGAPYLAARGVWVPGEAPPDRRRVRPGARLPGPLTDHVAPGDATVVADGVSFAYPESETDAVHEVRLSLRAAETLAIRGQNGSGKSTLAMMLAGLVRPSHGLVRAPPSSRPLHRWRARDLTRAVGTVFQEPEHQFLTRTVLDELLLGPRQAGVADPRGRVDPLLERLGLAHLAEANPFTLSGGEKRRLSVATALAAAPRTLILDEPTFGQDRRTWLELLGLLCEVRDAGHAVCFAGHDADFVSALADREVRLARGRMPEPRVLGSREA